MLFSFVLRRCDAPLSLNDAAPKRGGGKTCVGSLGWETRNGSGWHYLNADLEEARFLGFEVLGTNGEYISDMWEKRNGKGRGLLVFLGLVTWRTEYDGYDNYISSEPIS